MAERSVDDIYYFFKRGLHFKGAIKSNYNQLPIYMYCPRLQFVNVPSSVIIIYRLSCAPDTGYAHYTSCAFFYFQAV